MRLLAVVVVCLLTNSVEGLFGIRRFSRSARRSVEKVANVVEQESRAYRLILEQDVVPGIQETLKSVRTSSSQIVEIVGSLEKRIEETLKNVDDLIERIGYRMDNMADLIIILSMCFLFVVFGSLCDNRHFIIFYFSFQFIRIACVITAIMLSVRLMCELVFRVPMSTASTIKYCIIGPVLSILVWICLYLTYRALQPLRFVVSFILKGPSIIIYCAIDGPWRWTYRAYQYGTESKSKAGLGLSIFLPWLTLLVWVGVFYLFAGDIGDECSEQKALLRGLLVAYVFFLTSANYLRMFHLRPEPQQYLRKINNQNTKENRPITLSQWSKKISRP